MEALWIPMFYVWIPTKLMNRQWNLSSPPKGKKPSQLGLAVEIAEISESQLHL
jgi:hypothetical protein